MTDDLTNRIIGHAIEVHKNLGPGLLESAYEACLCHEFSDAGIDFKRQVPITVDYKGEKVDCAFRADLIVEDEVLLELKASDRLHQIHEAQLLTYLKLSGLKKGLLMNFNTTLLKNGIKRMVI